MRSATKGGIGDHVFVAQTMQHDQHAGTERELGSERRDLTMTTHEIMRKHGFTLVVANRELIAHANEKMRSDPVGALAQLTGTLYARKEGRNCFTIWHRMELWHTGCR